MGRSWGEEDDFSKNVSEVKHYPWKVFISLPFLFNCSNTGSYEQTGRGGKKYQGKWTLKRAQAKLCSFAYVDSHQLRKRGKGGGGGSDSTWVFFQLSHLGEFQKRNALRYNFILLLIFFLKMSWGIGRWRYCRENMTARRWGCVKEDISPTLQGRMCTTRRIREKNNKPLLFYCSWSGEEFTRLLSGEVFFSMGKEPDESVEGSLPYNKTANMKEKKKINDRWVDEPECRFYICHLWSQHLGMTWINLNCLGAVE